MKRSPYKLIALDLDGTLIGRELTISARVKSAIREALGAGIEVTLATGRMVQATLPFAHELGLKAPIICYQGALISDPVTKEILWHQPIPPHLAHQVIEEVRKTPLHINVYVDDELYVERITPWVQRYVQVLRVQAHTVDDLLAVVDKGPTALAAVGEEADVDQLLSHLDARFGSSLSVTKPFATFCQIAHPQGSKGKALAQLATHLGIAQRETVAVGDSSNDLDMVIWAGQGVAMANASPAVRAVADWVTGSLEEDGVALVIEKLLREELFPS